MIGLLAVGDEALSPDGQGTNTNDGHLIKCELYRPYRRGLWGTITIVSKGPRAIRRWNIDFVLALERGLRASRVWLDTRIGRSDFTLRELLLRAVPPSSTRHAVEFVLQQSMSPL